MVRFLWALGFLGAGALGLASDHGLVIPRFEGKFHWFAVGHLSAPVLKSLGTAKSFRFQVFLQKDLFFKKDGHGYTWFTFVVADQGPDSKWHQTTKPGAIPVSGDRVKAGRYWVTVPLVGIPTSVLKSKTQTLSIGPSCSGLAKPSMLSISGYSAK